MSAPQRRLRYPSSGPFYGAGDGVEQPPEVGEGSPGVAFRFQGDANDQVFQNGVSETQDFIFAGNDSSPAFGTSELVRGFWMDFEANIWIADGGIQSVSANLYFGRTGLGFDLIRAWNVTGFGFTEQVAMAWRDPCIYIPPQPLNGLPYNEFRLELTLTADSADTVVDNSESYAKFQTWAGTPPN